MEGKDEVSFFTALLKKKGIREIQIQESGGKEQFAELFKAIKKDPGFDNISSLAVIHDADQNATASFESVCSTLKNHRFEEPTQIGSFTQGTPKIGIFIISDDDKEKGMLESLCLSTIESKDIIKCVDSFMKCINKLTDNPNYKQPKNIHKARCRAFLSAMEEDTPSLGVAAKKGYWNMDSDKLNLLLDFLRKL